mgnify:FL=1
MDLGYNCNLLSKNSVLTLESKTNRLKIRGAVVAVNQINVAKENLIGAAFVGIWCTAANSSCYSIPMHYLLLLIL